MVSVTRDPRTSHRARPFDAIVKNGPNGANDRVVIGSVTQFSSFVVDTTTRKASFGGLPQGTYPTRFETCDGNFTCTFVVNGPTLEVGPLLKVTINDVGPEAQEVSVDPGAALNFKVVGPGNVYTNDRIVLIRQANNTVTSFPLGGQREIPGTAPPDKDIYFVYLMSTGSNQVGTEAIAANGPNLKVGKGLDGVDTRYYYDTDAIGSVRLITGDTGAVEARKDYVPFGGEWLSTSTPQSDRVLFAGQERDAESGLDYFGARYLSSNSGRFTSPDPIKFTADRLTSPWRLGRYQYARNSPVVYVDRLGLDDYYFDDTGEELMRVKRSKWANFFFGDTYYLGTSSGLYELESRPAKLKDGHYTILNKQQSRSYMNEFVAGREGREGHQASLSEVLAKSPTNRDWDFKNRDGNGRKLFTLDDGRLYGAEYVGNILWGDLMASHGYGLLFSWMGAGAFQLSGGKNIGPAYCFYDDCRDSRAILEGYRFQYQRTHGR
jgi:RHS repeat-associated protein